MSTPGDFPASLQLWLKADAITGLSDGAPVATWVDSSPAGNSAVQSSAGSKPTYKSGVLNGKPVVRFDGNDYLDSNAPTWATAQTVVALVKSTSLAGVNTIRGGGGGTGGLQFRIEASPTSNLRFVKQAVADIGQGNVAVTVNTWHVITGTWNDAADSYSFTIDGSPAGSGTSTQGLALASTSIGVNGQSLSEFFTGDMAELAAWDRVLTSTELNAVISGLQDKWLAAPPAATTGTVAAALPALTASAAGTVSAPPVAGTASAALPALTATITGTHVSNDQVGTVEAALPALQAAVDGTYTAAPVDGAVAVALPALTGDVSGVVPAVGIVGATLPPLTVAINDGSGDATGVLTATLPSLSGGVVGAVGNGIIVPGTGWNATDLPIDTVGGEIDVFPPFAVPPAGVTERRIVRRSVAVPNLRDIAGVVTDPKTGQPRITVEAWNSLPLVAPVEDLGVPHVIFHHRGKVVDATYYRGVPTIIGADRREEPFGDATCTLEFPGITTMDDEPEDPNHPLWFQINRAQFEIVLVKEGAEPLVVWAGHVISRDLGNDDRSPRLTLTCLGSLRQSSTDVHQPIVFQDPMDIGTLITRSLNKTANRRFPAIAAVQTGIMSMKRGAWQDSPLSYAQELLSTAGTVDGNQWTVAKVPGSRRTYELRLKKTTPEWTVTNGARGVNVDLTRDMTSVRNVIYGHGVGPDGYTWYNYKYPGLHLDDAPPYPFASASHVITVGTTDAQTDSGSGVSDWQRRVRDLGYRISIDGVFNSSDADIARAVQRQFGIQADGVPGPQTWNATFGVGSNIGDLTAPVRLPLAADPATQRWLYNADGSRAGENPAWDGNELIFADDVDFGTGITRAQGIQSAQQILARESTAGLVGRITLKSDPREGSRFLIPEGDKITLVGFEGKDRVLHITAVERDWFAGTVTLEVDEKSRDAMTRAQIIARNREARRDPARRPGNPSRRSRLEVDQVVPFDGESGAGRIPRMALYGGLWTVARVPVSETGKVAALDMTTTGPASKFCVAFFGAPITPAHMVKYVGNPLSDKSGWTKNRELLEDQYGWLEGVGSPDQPAGYWPGLASEKDPLTGRLKDTGGFEYVSARPPWIWMAVWSPVSTFVEGRILPAVVV